MSTEYGNDQLPYRKPNLDPWESTLGNILDNSTENPYEQFPKDDIEDAKFYNPQKAVLMEVANKLLTDARDRAEGERDREPIYHEYNWRITLETDGGKYVVINNNSLGDCLYIGYPVSHTVSDDLIRDELKVISSSPVRNVGATAVNSWDYEDEPGGVLHFKDKDKPLEQNEHGQIVAFSEQPSIEWAPFYGPIENQGGRVWVNHANKGVPSMSSTFSVVEDENVRKVYELHTQTRSIYTYPYDRHNKYAYEGPTANFEAIQGYKERFISLAAAIACHLGQVVALHIDYGFTFVPEELAKNGFEKITWIKGSPEERKGLGNEVIRASKDNQEIALVSGNALQPWTTIIRTDLKEELTSEELTSLIVDQLLYL
jgi:hypothetical protein